MSPGRKAPGPGAQRGIRDTPWPPRGCRWWSRKRLQIRDQHLQRRSARAGSFTRRQVPTLARRSLGLPQRLALILRLQPSGSPQARTPRARKPTGTAAPAARARSLRRRNGAFIGLTLPMAWQKAWSYPMPSPCRLMFVGARRASPSPMNCENRYSYRINR